MAPHSRLIDRITAEARQSAEEVCGALIGYGDVVSDALPLPNQSTNSAREFFIAADVVARVERDAERSGLQLLGFYHSHPGGSTEPSRFDRESALPGYIYLIVTPHGHARTWKLRDDRSAFDEIQPRLP